MKKTIRYILKTLKWVLIAIFSFYFIGITIFGFRSTNSNGTYGVYWSGIEAFWDAEEDFGFWTDKKLHAALDGVDGPYIIDDRSYYVNVENKIVRKAFNRSDSLIVNVNNSDKDIFNFQLSDDYSAEKSIYQSPKKLIAISDIEGNFDGFTSFLIGNEVIDNNFNWIFKKSHLVLNGDFVDRGSNVTAVLWLIYKLDYQATQQGGKVHFVLGNHEIMNFQGKWGYNNRKYIKAAQKISDEEDWDKAVQYMYSTNTELGRWLRSKNIIEKVGDYIFTHAGLNPKILDYNLSVKEINELTRQHWDSDLCVNPGNDEVANFLVGSNGPFWYRGLANGDVNENELDKILNYYQSRKVVIGHTVVKDISTDLNDKLIKIDIKHSQFKKSGKTKGILIENGIEYTINDLGKKQKL